MLFKSQLRRQFIVNLCLSCIPDIILAAVGANYFEGGYPLFGLIFIGLQAFGFVSWVLHSIIQWVYFLLIGRHVAKRQMYNFLIINQYPTPKEYETSAEGYFLSIMQNKELDPELRIKAAAEVGVFAGFSGAMDRQRLNKLLMAAEAAITDYRVWLAQERVERHRNV